jgi:hypothetical protein
MDTIRRLGALVLPKVPDSTERPSANVKPPDVAGGDQLIEQRGNIHTVGWEQRHLELNGLPLKDALVVRLDAKADVEQPREGGAANKVFVSKEAWMDGANAAQWRAS